MPRSAPADPTATPDQAPAASAADPRRSPARAAWVGQWLPLGLLAVLTLACYARFLNADFVGTDSLTAIASARIHSLHDLWTIFSAPLNAGSSFVEDQALFYRPVATLVFSADAALWGTWAVGYHVTNTLIQVAATLLAYAFLRSSGLARWTAFAGAALVGFHPGMAAAVPVIARRYDSLSAAALFGSLALLTLSATGSVRRVRLAQAGALVLLAVSLLCKETAFGILPLLPLLLFGCWSFRGQAERWRIGAYVRTLAPYLLVAALLFGLRYLVLGSLGGHSGVDYGAGLDVGTYQVLFGDYVALVFWPFRALHPESVKVWLAGFAAGGCLLAAAIGLLPGRYRGLVAAGLIWVVWFGVFFTVLRHISGAWYLYYPLAGLALALGAGAEGAVARWRQRSTLLPGLRRGSQLAAAATVLVLGGVYALGCLAESPLVRPYSQWQQAGQVVRQQLAGTVSCTQGLADGTNVTFWDLPKDFHDGSDETELLDITFFEPFTLTSYLQMTQPDRQFPVYVGSSETLSTAPPDMTVTCAWGGHARRRVITSASGFAPPDLPGPNLDVEP